MGQAVFVDELHNLDGAALELFQVAMEGASLGMYEPMVPWTLVGATTKLGKIPAPIRDRFGLTLHLNYYPPEDISKIVVHLREAPCRRKLRPLNVSE